MKGGTKKPRRYACSGGEDDTDLPKTETEIQVETSEKPEDRVTEKLAETLQKPEDHVKEKPVEELEKPAETEKPRETEKEDLEKPVEMENAAETEKEKELKLEKKVEMENAAERNPEDEDGELEERDEVLGCGNGGRDAAGSESNENDDNRERQWSVSAYVCENMYIKPEFYNKIMKIATNSYVEEAVKFFEEGLDVKEMEWFRNHRQFRHFFHMAREVTNKTMEFYLLLIRSAKIIKKKELWFIVNGVPIRYSMNEFAL